MGTATRPAKTAPAPWDAVSDLGAFIDAVLVELAAMAADGTRPHGRTLRGLPDRRWLDPVTATWRDGDGQSAPWPDILEYRTCCSTGRIIASRPGSSSCGAGRPVPGWLCPDPAGRSGPSARVRGQKKGRPVRQPKSREELPGR